MPRSKLDPRAVEIIHSLIDELATEIDLNYEDEEAGKLGETLQVILKARDFLIAAEADVPEAVDHVIRRFRDR